MHRTLTRALIIIGIISVFSGCTDKADKLKASLMDQANTTVNSVKDTANRAVEQVKTTKESIEKTVSDVNTAITEVQEAAAAVRKVTE